MISVKQELTPIISFYFEFFTYAYIHTCTHKIYTDSDLHF